MTSKLNITPGPWYVRHRPGPGWITSEVCYGSDDCCITDGVYEIADAQLMASAPDLYEALTDALCALEVCGRDFDHVMGKARRALEKARGETV